MTEVNLHFSPTSRDDEGSFKLIELPPSIMALFEGVKDGDVPAGFTIKGQISDDAVLCTSDKTFAIRSIQLSNSILVVSPPADGSEGELDPEAYVSAYGGAMGPEAHLPGGSSDPHSGSAASVLLREASAPANASPPAAARIVIRDQVKEMLELVPAVPRLQKLQSLLRGREYDGPDEDDDNFEPGADYYDAKPKYTFQRAQEEIQASEAELIQGLKEARILHIHGDLRPIAKAYLSSILELVLNLLVSLSLLPQASLSSLHRPSGSQSSPPLEAAVEPLYTALADDHEVPRSVSTQVMEWFGEIKNGKWYLTVKEIVRELGISILRNHKDDPIGVGVLLSRWRDKVGDTFEQEVALELLEGNYITPHSAPARHIKYFPRSALPSDPAARFRDLFLTKPRWRLEEIKPFLEDIAVDGKERDRLLLKYARAVNVTATAAAAGGGAQAAAGRGRGGGSSSSGGGGRAGKGREELELEAGIWYMPRAQYS